MAKEKISYKAVDDIIAQWSKDTKKTAQGRYTIVDLKELDRRLAGYLGEIKEYEYTVKSTGAKKKMQMVYYGYHSVVYVLRLIDPTLKFHARIVDYNKELWVDAEGKSTVPVQILTQPIYGLSAEAWYESSVLPKCNNPISLQLMDNKNNPLRGQDLDTGEVEFGKQRAIVKAIAENTFFGYMCWLKPSWVMAEIGTQPENKYASMAQRIVGITETAEGTDAMMTSSKVAEEQLLIDNFGGGVSTPITTPQVEATAKKTRATKKVTGIQITPLTNANNVAPAPASVAQAPVSVATMPASAAPVAAVPATTPVTATQPPAVPATAAPAAPATAAPTTAPILNMTPPTTPIINMNAGTPSPLNTPTGSKNIDALRQDVALAIGSSDVVLQKAFEVCSQAGLATMDVSALNEAQLKAILGK